MTGTANISTVVPGYLYNSNLRRISCQFISYFGRFGRSISEFELISASFFRGYSSPNPSGSSISSSLLGNSTRLVLIATPYSPKSLSLSERMVSFWGRFIKLNWTWILTFPKSHLIDLSVTDSSSCTRLKGLLNTFSQERLRPNLFRHW